MSKVNQYIEQHFHALGGCGLFENLDPRRLDSLLSQCEPQVKSYPRGAIVFSSGEKLQDIYIVISGKLKTVHDTESSGESLVEFLETSQCFAFAYCALNQLCLVSLRAQINSVVVKINYDRLFELCNENREYGVVLQNLVRMLADKVLILAQKIEYMYIKTLRAKLSSYLLNCHFQQDKEVFKLDKNRTDLAEYLGISRSSMTRELSLMQKQGLIAFEGQVFKILNLKGLMENTVN